MQLKHEETDEEPVIADALPAGHIEHVVAPRLDEYDPAGHSVHVTDPISEEYEPRGHDTQLSLLGLAYLPAPHAMHDKELVDPAAKVMLPLGHEMQVEDPTILLYDPEGHDRQALGDEPAVGE